MPYLPKPACPGSNRCPNRKGECLTHPAPRPFAGARPIKNYGSEWDRLSARIRRENPICQLDGCDQPSAIADHIVARVDGGPDSPENLRAVCRHHHAVITGRQLRERSLRSH